MADLWIFDPAFTSASPLPADGVCYRLIPVASEDDAAAWIDRPLIAAIEAHDADEVIRLLRRDD